MTSALLDAPPLFPYDGLDVRGPRGGAVEHLADRAGR